MWPSKFIFQSSLLPPLFIQNNMSKINKSINKHQQQKPICLYISVHLFICFSYGVSINASAWIHRNYDMALKAMADCVLVIWWCLCFWEQIICNVNIPRLSINHANPKGSVFDYLIFFLFLKYWEKLPLPIFWKEFFWCTKWKKQSSVKLTCLKSKDGTKIVQGMDYGFYSKLENY